MVNDFYHLKTGSAITDFNFDSWGRRRDKDDWSYTLTSEPALFADRGFTSHEFLADFNLYNMNGRLYDPVVGRFLSPDPFIQEPSFSQSYNRYSYCLNNPLKFTDYSGEKWNWNNLNPFYHFQNFMQWVNDKTPGLRQNMVNARVPDFGVNYNTTFGTGFSVGNNPAYYPFYENKIVKGQQGISNQLAGFSGLGANSGSPRFADGSLLLREMTWDPVTNIRIGTLDSRLIIPVTDFINSAQSQGVNLRITQGFRSIAQQDALYNQGRTTPGKIVTNAKGGQSYHNYGLAFDVVIMQNGRAVWDRIPNDIGALGVSYGFEWGGNWRTFKDYPHFQMTFGQSVLDLQKR